MTKVKRLRLYPQLALLALFLLLFRSGLAHTILRRRHLDRRVGPTKWPERLAEAALDANYQAARRYMQQLEQAGTL